MKQKGIIKKAVISMLLSIFLSAGLLLNTADIKATAVNDKLSDGVYSIPVSLWHATKDQESLGNKSLYQTGKLVITEGKGRLYLKFTGMELSGLSGYLLQLDLIENIKFNEFNYPEKYTLIPAEVVSAYTVVDDFNSKQSTDVNTAGKNYPKVITFPVGQGSEYLWAHVYVPVMGSLGFGDQVCRIKLSFEQATSMTEEETSRWEEYETDEPETEDKADKTEVISPSDKTDKTEKSETKQETGDKASATVISGNTKELKTVYAKAKKLLQKKEYTKASLSKLKAVVIIAEKALKAGSGQLVLDAQTKALEIAIGELVKKAEQILDKDSLRDGKYSVYVDLWNASSEKASMGNPALNHEALLTVKGGDYNLTISTRPMTVAGITACLQTLQIKQPNGTYEAAKVTARNNTDNQPSVFQFKLPSKEEYMEVLIDPKVEIVTKEVLPARLKISWDTLKELNETATIKENTQTVKHGETAPAADITDAVTGVRITASANMLSTGTRLLVNKLTTGEEYNQTVNLLTTEASKLQIYQITLSAEPEGKEVQPFGMVTVYLPLPEEIAQDKVVVYRIEKGAKVLITGKATDGYYIFETNHFSLYTLGEKGENGLANEAAISVLSEKVGGSKEKEAVETLIREVKGTSSENKDREEVKLLLKKEGWAMTRMLLGISMISSFVITMLVIIFVLRAAEGKRRSHETE